MPSPTEQKTVPAPILAYAQETGWTVVLREEAERPRGFDADAATAEEWARRASHYFGDPAFSDAVYRPSLNSL